MVRFATLVVLAALNCYGAPALQLTSNWSNYFASEICSIEASGLRTFTNLVQWESRKEEHRLQLAEMLGLHPMPERTDLKAVVTGRLEGEGFTVEKLHFQASPRLYVTANIYIPGKLSGKAPGVLYVCGHSRVVKDDVSYGNKTAYQHHGAWFAQNGYVCLVIDTLQYGEIQGAHRGTYSDEQWWWNSRGYTPLGIEAWFAIRALDYLCSRPEVDAVRIGMSGRSGGGAYTWAVAALDDRIKVAAPVAGMTDLRNQVLDGKVDGHCDCMFHVNTYRWDFPMIGALVAPRPLLIANTDKDRLFPLDGVLRVHQQILGIYELHGRQKDLGLVITEGDHDDTQELQVSVFRWFNKYLRPAHPGQNGEDTQLAPAKAHFTPQQLRVFESLPTDELNTTAAEWFNSRPPEFKAGTSEPEGLKKRLREMVFRGWPGEEPVSPLNKGFKVPRADKLRIWSYDLMIQPGVTQQLFAVTLRNPTKPRHITLLVADDELAKSLQLAALEKKDGSELTEMLNRLAPGHDGTVHVLVPRGVMDDLTDSKQMSIQFRRRFMLLGQTLDGMRVWDIRCAISALRQAYGNLPTTIVASGIMAVNASYAALFESRPVELKLTDIPADWKQGPDYMNVARILDKTSPK